MAGLVDVIQTLLWTGLFFYIAQTINKQVSKYLELQEPLADQHYKTFEAKLAELQSQVNAVNIHQGIRDYER